jgi:ribosomal protein S18 acetylase RimI-like enzyme
MPEGYTLVGSTPSVADYRRLRAAAGLSPKTQEQAEPALTGTWWGCHVVHDASSEVVAMGRVIGDGGWYFHIADMATLPGHQRRGLGDLVLTTLLDRIRESAPAGAYVTLMADPPGRRLYARHGFTEDRDASIGMALLLD